MTIFGETSSDTGNSPCAVCELSCEPFDLHRCLYIHRERDKKISLTRGSKDIDTQPTAICTRLLSRYGIHYFSAPHTIYTAYIELETLLLPPLPSLSAIYIT